MKKHIRLISVLLGIVLVTFIGVKIYAHITNKNGDSRTTNDKAEEDEDDRYLTVINDTGQIINEVYVTIGDGTELSKAYQKNPDEKSFSIKISKEFEEYNAFTITLIDRYELQYKKEITGVKQEGRTEVKISENDYFAQKGDWKRKIEKFFNGD